MLGSLVHNAAVISVVRSAVLITLDEVLPNLRADHLHDKSEVAQNREVAKNGVALLVQVLVTLVPVSRDKRAEEHGFLADPIGGRTS